MPARPSPSPVVGPPAVVPRWHRGVAIAALAGALATLPLPTVPGTPHTAAVLAIAALAALAGHRGAFAPVALAGVALVAALGPRLLRGPHNAAEALGLGLGLGGALLAAASAQRAGAVLAELAGPRPSRRARLAARLAMLAAAAWLVASAAR